MKRKLAIAEGILIVAVIVIAIALWMDSQPGAQPKQTYIDLRTLIPARPELPIESNEFALLVQAGKSLKVSGSEPILANYTNWNEAEARDLLASNQAAMSTMYQAWMLPYLQVDAITNPIQEFNYLFDWKSLAQLSIVEARLSFNHGQEREGFEQAMDVVRFGQHIQGAEGEQIHYLVGWAIKNLGLQCLRQFADTTSLSGSNLFLISEELTNFEASQGALRETLKVEYTVSAMNLDGMDGMMATSSPSVFSTKLVYDSGRSKEEMAAQILSTMKALTNSYAAGIAYVPVEDTNSSFPSFMIRFLHGNMIGSLLNDMTLDARGKMLAGKCRENVTVRATRVVLALKAFQIINHRPANSLQELVPDFLDEVPLDDFDGKPLRYNLTLKEVYSVGTDLKDAGGIKSTNSTNIIFPFKF